MWVIRKMDLLHRPASKEQEGINDNNKYYEHLYFKMRRYDWENISVKCKEVFDCLSLDMNPGTPPLKGQRIMNIGCDSVGTF